MGDITNMPDRILEAWCIEYLRGEFDECHAPTVHSSVFATGCVTGAKKITMGIDFNFLISIELDYFKASDNDIKDAAKKIRKRYWELTGFALERL